MASKTKEVVVQSGDHTVDLTVKCQTSQTHDGQRDTGPLVGWPARRSGSQDSNTVFQCTTQTSERTLNELARASKNENFVPESTLTGMELYELLALAKELRIDHCIAACGEALTKANISVGDKVGLLRSANCCPSVRSILCYELASSMEELIPMARNVPYQRFSEIVTFARRKHGTMSQAVETGILRQVNEWIEDGKPAYLRRLVVPVALPVEELAEAITWDEENVGSFQQSVLKRDLKAIDEVRTCKWAVDRLIDDMEKMDAEIEALSENYDSLLSREWPTVTEEVPIQRVGNVGTTIDLTKPAGVIGGDVLLRSMTGMSKRPVEGDYGGLVLFRWSHNDVINALNWSSENSYTNNGSSRDAIELFFRRPEVVDKIEKAGDCQVHIYGYIGDEYGSMTIPRDVTEVDVEKMSVTQIHIEPATKEKFSITKLGLWRSGCEDEIISSKLAEPNWTVALNDLCIIAHETNPFGMYEGSGFDFLTGDDGSQCWVEVKLVRRMVKPTECYVLDGVGFKEWELVAYADDESRTVISNNTKSKQGYRDIYECTCDAYYTRFRIESVDKDIKGKVTLRKFDLYGQVVYL